MSKTIAQPAVEKHGYSLDEATQASSLSRRTLEYLIAEGRLDAVKVGKRVIIKARSLKDLLEAQ